MRNACTDGEDRFGANGPATGSNLENPVRPLPLAGEKTTPVGYTIEYLRQGAVDILEQ